MTAPLASQLTAGKDAAPFMDQAIVASSSPLQLTYRGGTVNATSVSSYAPAVGDTVSITVQGNSYLVIGQAVNQANGRSDFMMWQVQGGTLVTSVTGEVAISAWTTGGAYTLRKGSMYQIRVSGAAYSTGTLGSAGRAIVRVRQSINSVSATQLVTAWVPLIGGSQTISFERRDYINIISADISTILGVTIQANIGGNAALYSDGNVPLVVTCECLGSAKDLPSVAAMALQI